MAEYHVENFGCRASRSDGEAIAATLRLRGLEPAGTPAAANVVILNTCSVTAEADHSARAFLRRVKRQNPAARVIVTGCYAQRASEEVAALPGVDAVIGNSHKALVAEAASGLAGTGFVPVTALTGERDESRQVLIDDFFAHAELAALPFAADARQTRPNLKAQDGCGNRCSFCIIPATRGPSRSMDLESCLDGVRRFVNGGGQELVLSGINLGRWGRDLVPARKMEDLVAAILMRTSLPRLRISSVEPMDWTPGLLDLYRAWSVGSRPRLARHAHLPLQSGSDTLLRLMHRRYRPWHYAERLAQIREAMPEAGIGADVMVGFPGETDSLFAESYRFIESQPFTYLHLFPFSARPGTPAWKLHRESPVSAGAVNERMAALRRLIREKSIVFRSGFAGQELSVVTLRAEPGLDHSPAEKGTSPLGTSALADNFLQVSLENTIPANQLLSARITGITSAGLTGRIVPEPA